MAVASWGIILNIKVGVGEVTSESVGPPREVREWLQHSGQAGRAGMANPKAFRELANHAEVGRHLCVRLCGLEASLPEDIQVPFFL